ncbi:MAG: hypothetical protein GY952_14050 [Rhodobacteraceae bacterium]|nr:hypothetical protein [Paracoccaceae bacterium]
MVDKLQAKDVVWIVNDISELGVRIGDQCFFLYKGESLVYEAEDTDSGNRMLIRTVGKREFGETCQPINMDDVQKASLMGINIRNQKVSASDCDRWQPMPDQLPSVEPE